MKKFISDLILVKLGHEPTPGQKEMIDSLAEFVSNSESDRLFLLKGYAGTGKTSAISALVKVLDELKSSLCFWHRRVGLPKYFPIRVVNLPPPFTRKSIGNKL